jgi:hypothetical protein
MRLRRKSKKRQAAELLETYLKFKAVQKTAKGAGKAAKGTAAYKVAKKTPVVRTVPAVLVAAVAAVFATKKLRSGSGSTQPVTPATA